MSKRTEAAVLTTPDTFAPPGSVRDTVAPLGVTLSPKAPGTISSGGWTATLTGHMLQGWSGQYRDGVAPNSESLPNFVAPTIPVPIDQGRS